MNSTETKTISQFCHEHGISIRRCERADSNPLMMDSANMDHWKVQLQIRDSRECRSRRMTIPFSMGFGHGGRRPEIEELLNALASDYTDESVAFEDFCAEFGYDSDSRSAERTFKACQKQTRELIRFLGEDLCKELVYETERL